MAARAEYDCGDAAREYLAQQRAFYAQNPDQSRELIYRRLGSLRGKRVLDAGCGFGKDVLLLLEKGADAYGIDASREMIALGKHEGVPAARLAVRSIEQTGFRSGFFDAIISRYALHYCWDLERAYRELGRVLKPGGQLLIAVSHPIEALAMKRWKGYQQKRLLRMILYRGTMTARFPSHMFADYFPPSFLRQFDVLEIAECKGKRYSKDPAPKAQIPCFLFIRARKRATSPRASPGRSG